MTGDPIVTDVALVGAPPAAPAQLPAVLPVAPPAPKAPHRRRRAIAVLMLIAATAAGGYWRLHSGPVPMPGFAAGNGRLEADEIDIDTKFAGRIQELRVDASVAIVDEDHSGLSRRITHAFLPPYFQTPQPIAERDIVPLMNAGKYTFAVDIPPHFERDVIAGRSPGLQLDVDATAMVQAGLGASYAQQIITTEINGFLSRTEGAPVTPVDLVTRIEFNPNVETSWFSSVMGIINSITMLAIVLAGAAIVREREHGTMDHLLVMPVSPLEIAAAKVWANSLVIIVAAGLSLYFVVRALLHIPIAGSVPLFLAGTALYLFFATSIGVFLGTVARSMPQLGLLYLLIYVPLALLSGSNTPLESMPIWMADIAQFSPTAHFVSFAQAILYRGAGFPVVWRQFLEVALFGALFFVLALLRFRKVASQTA